MNRRSILLSLPVIAAASATIAQTFPDRPVRLVVPFPPGGSYDVIARLLSRPLQDAWGQPVIVENRPGAGGNIGADSVSKAAPDGTTLLLWGDGLLINQALSRTRPWDALRDFAPVARIAESPQVLVSAPGRGVDTLAALLARARTRDVTYGTAGNGTPGHLAGELLRSKSNARLTHVPYRGGAPALADLLGGQIDAVFTGIPACLPFIRDNKAVALGVSSATRFSLLPEAPAIADTVPEVAVDTWYGLLGPARLPEPLRARIADSVRTALTRPDTAETLRAQGFEPAASDPAALGALLMRDAPRWAEMVSISGATAD
ncbi:tripartite tricarboxylate transporter substrate binding protein [Muricoccus radiodurans]|uniref:tripartite tricarboxylate transporter substrate binding protein n=1 Tax=Muricoccus radiodurans TaxID=2231721 RepID=UPI003CE6CA48